MTDNPLLGKILGGRYRLDELLGQGGMSSVYKATDPNLRRSVAVKLIHTHLSNQPEFVHRFEEEAAAVAQLRHPNIIQVYDFNHDDDTYYMVLEFLPGETLYERLKRYSDAGQRIACADAARYAAGVCDAVDFAHRRGMIHRDIKPANIMLDGNNQAILMDFGIAKIVGGVQQTATGSVMGTALYMSPEQIRGERIDGRSDIYSIGVTLFEMVGGRPPFEGDSAMTLMMAHLHHPVPDLRQLRPDVPEALAAIIERSLAKSPTVRFSSAAEMSAALRREVTNLQMKEAGASSDGLVQVYQPTIRQSGSTPAPMSRVSAMGSGMASQGTSASYAPSASYGSAASRSPVDSRPMTRPGTERNRSAAQTLPRPRWFAAGGGCAVVLLILICLLGVSSLYVNQSRANQSNERALQTIYAATQTLIERTRQALALLEAGVTPTPPSPTENSVPTETVAPSEAPAPTEATTPVALPETSGPAVEITGIRVEGDTIVVDYETIGFIERPGSRHLHFYLHNPNHQPSEDQQQYIMHPGPRPFSGYTIGDIPQGATQMCALVAMPDHTMLQETIHCMDLPAVEIPTPAPGAQPTPKPTKEKDVDPGYYSP